MFNAGNTILLAHPVFVAFVAEMTYEHLNAFFGQTMIIWPGF